MKRKKFKLSTSQFILLGFMAVILLGSVLLSLPISTVDGVSVSYIDALFTATTATCVTGLVTVPTFSTWSLFGQIVILILIQVGGLGIVTVMSGAMILFHRKIGIADRLLIQDAFNLNTLHGLVAFVKKVLAGTLIVEAVGALLYMFVFVPDFGLKGIWISVFNSVSAFCNAGIDIFAADSLCGYAKNPLINIVTCMLIILGGLGYIVWWDIIRVYSYRKTGIKSRINRLTLHSKIAILATVLFIVIGAVLIFVFEYNNPDTIKDFFLLEKIQASVFQSVTCRTAGFMTIPQENFTNASAVVSVILMLVGGSPVGTAGGIKTVTVIILICAAYSVIKGNDDVNIFGRRISEQAIRKSVAVTGLAILIAVLSTVLLAFVTPNVGLTDIVYETVSATATVGLSRNLTSGLNLYGKLIIIFTMYFGRIGPISLAFALKFKKSNKLIVKNPIEELSVG
ncbi:MAG: potassium transporter KtrB [Ruminococcaceae bacterium]|nr:potassium transporter KtrB [Oscillospiraceae bacterium]